MNITRQHSIIQSDSLFFFIYNVTDSFTKQKNYILSINAVHENGTKLNLNFDVGYPFFDIKLDSTHNFTFYLDDLADKKYFLATMKYSNPFNHLTQEQSLILCVYIF